MSILSIYGIHRYFLTYLYLKNKQKAPKPQKHTGPLPRVTIQLPIYNERYVVERLLEAVTRIDYPRALLEIQLLDDSTDETRFVASRLVSEYARAGHPVSYHHRDNREGFKAGALAEGLKQCERRVDRHLRRGLCSSPSRSSARWLNTSPIPGSVSSRAVGPG